MKLYRRVHHHYVVAIIWGRDLVHLGCVLIPSRRTILIFGSRIVLVSDRRIVLISGGQIFLVSGGGIFLVCDFEWCLRS